MNLTNETRKKESNNYRTSNSQLHKCFLLRVFTKIRHENVEQISVTKLFISLLFSTQFSTCEKLNTNLKKEINWVIPYQGYSSLFFCNFVTTSPIPLYYASN